MKSPLKLIRPQTYYVTRSGVLQSLRKPQDGNIRIGKESIAETSYIYNDIMLPTQDPLSARCHCMINYQEFFESPITDPILAFLFGGHYRLGRNSILLNLPQTLFKYILDFLIELHFPILISPNNSTFLRISNLHPFVIYSGLVLIIGSNLVLQVFIENFETLKVFVNRSNENFFEFRKNKKEKEKEEFLIGREELKGIGNNEGKISRIQCRFFYERGDWKILDGGKRPTVNGTWALVSRPERLRKCSEIRIAECVLKVEW